MLKSNPQMIIMKCKTILLNFIYGQKKKNGLLLNVSNYLQITFMRTRYFIHHQYVINGYNLIVFNHFKNLGVFLFIDLFFSKHITYICHKASSTFKHEK